MNKVDIEVKKRYFVRERTTEIISEKMAHKICVGITLNPEFNRGNIDPVSEEEFSTEKEAWDYLFQCKNDYWYNGSGCGYAREFFLEVEDSEGELIEQWDTPFGNMADFRKEWEYEV